VFRCSGVDTDEVDGVLLCGIIATGDTNNNAVNGHEACRFPGDFCFRGSAKRIWVLSLHTDLYNLIQVLEKIWCSSQNGACREVVEAFFAISRCFSFRGSCRTAPRVIARIFGMISNVLLLVVVVESRV